MKNKKSNFIYSLYENHLVFINDVRLTKREVDIISFFINGRSAKKIAAFFAISPKTVENHTHNIMLKLGRHSREGIIDFIESSGKLTVIRKYYTALFAQDLFEKDFKNIALQAGEESKNCILSYDQEENLSSLMASLEDSLSLLGLNIAIKEHQPSDSFASLTHDNPIIYFVSDQVQDLQIRKDTSENNKSTKVLLVSSQKNEPIEIFDAKSLKELCESFDIKNYYSLVFSILKGLFSQNDFDTLIQEFENKYKDIEVLSIKNDNISFINDLNKYNNNFYEIIKNNKFKTISLLLCIFLLCMSFFAKDLLFYNDKNYQAATYPIRSDLVIPVKDVLLNRQDLLDKIHDRFKGWLGIQTIALVGIEGAGKTTLARNYATSQALTNVWEINAESRETLNQSFEKLAQDLSKTEDDRKILAGILKLKLSREREEKVIQFVKQKLRMQPNWFLIYDNVEKFTDIQDHFPKDSARWGQGRIILTTRDGNIENNKHVNNVIYVKDLTAEDKLELFIKIMDNEREFVLTSSQKNEAKRFLSSIPSFPLDVVIAAYYLRATQISYKGYLKSMANSSKDISSFQEKILHNAGDYKKTRYGIVTLALKQLMEVQDDFKDLLLLISLLDSQNIPRDILIQFKGNSIVDNFIYHLKKYSLILRRDQNFYSPNPVFSLHRSIQEMMRLHLIKSLQISKGSKIVDKVAKILVSYMKNTLEREDFEGMKAIFRHAEHFLTQESLLTNEIKGSLFGELGCIYYYLCDYQKAIIFLEKGISCLEKYNINNKDEIAHFTIYLGNVYRRLGDFERAKQLLQQGIEDYKKLQNPPMNGRARAYGYLGAVHECLGDYEKAKTLLEESLGLYRRYAKDTIGIAWSLAHLGSVYKNLGDFKRARDIFEESLAIYKTYSESYVGVSWVSGDLGNVYMSLKEYDKARPLLEEAFKICNKHFFVNHVYMAEILIYRGIFYRELEKYEEAKNFLKKGLVSLETSYEKNHVKIGFVLKDLAKTYLLEGNINTALDIMQKSIHILNQHNDPNKYEAFEILADIYLKKAEKLSLKTSQEYKMYLKESASYLKQASDIITKHFYKNAPQQHRIQSKIKTLPKGL